MPRPSPPEVTQLLLAWSNGDQTALESLTPLVYEELRGLPIGTWLGSVRVTRCKPTALVHEAYLRLIDGKKVQWHTSQSR